MFHRRNGLRDIFKGLDKEKLIDIGLVLQLDSDLKKLTGRFSDIGH